MQSTSDAFSSLLSDPRALSAIAELMSSLQKAPPPPTASPSTSDTGEAPAETAQPPFSPPPPPPPPPPSPPPQKASSTAPDLSGMLGAALSNPELLSALPSVMSMLSGMGGGAPSAPRIGALGARESTPVFDRRCALLNALKPYLPEDKRSAVDTVVRVIEIMSLIK